MAGIYEHIEFQKETPITDKRPRSPFFPPKPSSPAEHAKGLQNSLQSELPSIRENKYGFDERLLLRLQVQEGIDPTLFEKVPGVEAVSQESIGVSLVFVSETALIDFQERLEKVIDGRTVTNKEVLYAISSLGAWSAEDRKGPALKSEGLPTADDFLLDIELWPLVSQDERSAMQEAFSNFVREHNIGVLDSAVSPSTIIYRLQVSQSNYSSLFEHRDVRRIDLPPIFKLSRSLITLPIEDFPETPPPPDDAPIIGVLDTGINSSHPLLSSAVAENRDFLESDGGASDDSNHGTAVAGLALYNDIAAHIDARTFEPQFHILSGKVVSDNAHNRLIINQIRAAVEAFQQDYDCHIFNISVADERHSYSRGYMGSFAVMLDELAREKNVLFLVPAGNFEDVKSDPDGFRQAYPGYLEHAPLQDPGPSINSITVGSIARYESPYLAQSTPADPVIQPIARHNHPSPFTRIGPSVNDILKPDFVDYGGNQAANIETGQGAHQGLGEVSFNARFVGGNLFHSVSGTSFAVPHVAHYSGLVQSEVENASPDLIRAILAVHAERPRQAIALLEGNHFLDYALGYGMVDIEYLSKSGNDVVTLYAQEQIENKKNHFFEIPIPDEFLSGSRRQREIHIALAYTPPVRSTRVKYKASRIEFNLIQRETLDEVTRFFQGKRVDDIQKMPEYNNKRVISKQLRSRGTLQKSSWTLKQPSKKKKYFVVVTRYDEIWGESLTKELESYALAIRLTDKENAEARLHSEITQIIRNRARVRHK